jgi:hypothetical protein
MFLIFSFRLFCLDGNIFIGILLAPNAGVMTISNVFIL